MIKMSYDTETQLGPAEEIESGKILVILMV